MTIAASKGALMPACLDTSEPDLAVPFSQNVDAWGYSLRAALESPSFERPDLAFLGPHAQHLGVLRNAMARIDRQIVTIWQQRQRLELDDDFSSMTGWRLEGGMIKAEGSLNRYRGCGDDEAFATFPQELLALNAPQLSQALALERHARDQEEVRRQAQEEADAEEHQRRADEHAQRQRRMLYEQMHEEFAREALGPIAAGRTLDSTSAVL